MRAIVIEKFGGVEWARLQRHSGARAEVWACRDLERFAALKELGVERCEA